MGLNQIVYNGIQQGFGKVPSRYVFTDTTTGGSFVAPIGGSFLQLFTFISKRLRELAIDFA